jgi:hypothetical protein
VGSVLICFVLVYLIFVKEHLTNQKLGLWEFNLNGSRDVTRKIPLFHKKGNCLSSTVSGPTNDSLISEINQSDFGTLTHESSVYRAS